MGKSCLNCLYGQEEDGTIICAIDDSITEEPCERWEGVAD